MLLVSQMSSMQSETELDPQMVVNQAKTTPVKKKTYLKSLNVKQNVIWHFQRNAKRLDSRSLLKESVSRKIE